MTAILDPATPDDMMPLDTWSRFIVGFRSIECLEEMGRYFEATAARAIVGARMAAFLAQERRRCCREFATCNDIP